MAVSVSLENVGKSFLLGGEMVEVIKNLSLFAADGEFVSLLGPSGCGKSTVLNLISGLFPSDGGRISFPGGSKPRVSYMPQKDLLLPWRTVMENACIPLEIRGVSKSEGRKRAGELMEMFGLSGFENSYPGQLSGGMRQRAAVLRTFLHQGQILLLDEPFGKLDALTRTNLQLWLISVWEEFRQSVLFVTHDIEEAVFLSDRIYVMTDRPGTVKEELRIALPRPRTLDLLSTPEFVAVKKRIRELL